MLDAGDPTSPGGVNLSLTRAMVWSLETRPIRLNGMRDSRLTHYDFAAALQARICADLEAEKLAHAPCKRPDSDERRRVENMEAQIVTLEEALATAEVLAGQRRQEAESAAKRIGALEAHIATLQEAVAKAEALSEQQRQEAQMATKRANQLVAELVEMTGEFVEMSKQKRTGSSNMKYAEGIRMLDA
jgi:DNA-binding protein H-NS